MWKEHFKNLLGDSSKVTDKPIMKIIKSQQNIKVGQFAQELDIVKKNPQKPRKAASLEEILPEV